jgi:hypothetical protein
MFQQRARRHKPIKGTTQRIEEVVTALYPLMPISKVGVGKNPRRRSRPTILPLRALIRG